MANFNTLTPELAEQLKAIVGEKRFQYGDKVKEDYSHDEMPIYGKFAPDAVCEVESTEEVSAILKLCSPRGIPTMVTQQSTPARIQPRPETRPIRINQNTFAMKLIIISSFLPRQNRLI